MRRFVLVFVALGLACSRETPAPPTPPATAADTAPTQTAPSTATSATSVPQLQKGTYDEALLWLRSAPKFRFTVADGDVRADGEMTRKTPGAERVRFRADGDQWEAEAQPQGIVWKRNGKPSDPPRYGNRVYQRVTLAIDPQKKEGVPMLVSSEGDTNLDRFTDANTGEVHEITVRKSDSSIARMKIGEKVEITFAP